MNRASQTILAVLLASAAVLPGHAAAPERKPNTLTPNEISQGWMLLFDGETMFGWAQRGDSKWTVTDGTIQVVKDSGIGYLSTTTEFANYNLSVEFWIDDVANSGVFLRCPTTGPISGTNAYEVNIYDKHEKWPTGSINEVARAANKVQSVGRWCKFDIMADQQYLVVGLDGQKMITKNDPQHARGTIALQYNGQGDVKFRNIRVQPLRLTSIFNGKDLKGWKEVPGHKSVYSVTPESWLNVKNGNGDLQTEGVYGDFTFQIEVISNGKHLNSGIFFRAEPGQFWIGYESQIRNQWEGDDRTKPVDFGTGAIYRRQAARRVVSSDGEWFTKTIVAHGPHMAVWVNGIQVSDFTDTREPNDNAREGYRAKPGVISLQGHDPTTDLSFRRIRVAEMPPARN